ncbi:hypothetical protein ACH5RR_028069 [Cinchona calisaya]|uniref:Uncharacterized protein n=1 Tax=Cinchona calisaya TaxID=153742 RepID=A0ABD2YT08_9GENT
MASSTTSKLLSLSKSNAALQSLIRRHLLRPTTTAANAPFTLLKPTPEQKQTEEKLLFSNPSEMLKQMVGFSGLVEVDRFGTLQADRVDSEQLPVDSDGNFGFQFHDDDDYEDDEDDVSEDDEDEDDDSD